MEKKISRRDMIKALIAGSGGIVAAGFVPEKWLKPVVKSGVLPVHAQASITPTSVPDLFIRGGYYEYMDQNEDEGIMAFALVSYKDIPPFSPSTPLSKVSVFEYPVVDSPAKDANVSLYVGETKEGPTKITDENGLVTWFIEYEFVNGVITSIDPFDGAKLTFILENNKKESVVNVVPWRQGEVD